MFYVTFNPTAATIVIVLGLDVINFC